MRAGEVMTRDVVTVRPDATLREAACLMDDLNVGALPVCDGRRLVGIITDRDITVRATADGMRPDATPVHVVMTDDVCWCFEDDFDRRDRARDGAAPDPAPAGGRRPQAPGRHADPWRSRGRPCARHRGTRCARSRIPPSLTARGAVGETAARRFAVTRLPGPSMGHPTARPAACRAADVDCSRVAGVSGIRRAAFRRYAA